MNVGYALGEAQTRALLQEACAVAGLSARGARLLRLGSNAVYRLAAPVVVRIARPDADSESARRTVAVARWLQSAAYPAVRATDVDQPVITGGHAVTFWEAIPGDGGEYATIAEVAGVIGRLHKLSAPDNLHLPELAPFENAGSRISGSEWLSPGDRDYMTSELARLQGEYARLDFVLPQGVIHGDANIGNVLHDEHGKPVVIDLDGFAVGPREWDLIQTALYYDHYGWHTREEYETFTRVYGYDIMQWPGYPVLADAREFIQVTWMIQKAGESEKTTAEARKRISALRHGASRKDWLPFLAADRLFRPGRYPPEPRFCRLLMEIRECLAVPGRQVAHELTQVADTPG
jgi:aminoglycoside phosphotransferase (APT) family kinase protein